MGLYGLVAEYRNIGVLGHQESRLFYFWRRDDMKKYYVCPKCGKRIYPDPAEAVTLAGFYGNQYI